MNSITQRLCSMIEPLAVVDGLNTTNIPYLNIYQSSDNIIVLPDTPNPYILLVVDGRMRLHLLTGIKDFIPGQFLISAIDSPVSGQVLDAAPAKPFRAISIDFSIDDATGVMLDIDGDLPEKLFERDSGYQPQSDTKLLDVILRLLNMNEQPDELSFMCKHLRREIIFNLIAGPYGKEFMQGIIKIQQAGDIYNINSWIKHNYKASFTVEKLAEQSNMSLSSFHQKFKSAVGMGPLQCQKKLRLQEGRRLMLDDARTVTDAALEVGYESVSQFIRDYGRMFGRSPQKDIQVIRDCFQTKA